MLNSQPYKKDLVMRALVYVDIETGHVMAQLLRSLHTYFVKHPNTFALAFPRLRMGAERSLGDVVRVFAQQIDAFAGLMEWFHANHRIKSALICRAPNYVDNSKIIKWIEYRRYHIGSAKDVPYVRMRSGRGDIFMLRICALESVATPECYPTSYGLSGERRFSLPVLKDSQLIDAL